MPLIRGNHEGRAAVIQVAIVDAARHREHKASGEPVLKGVIPFKALIDTGATTTMIATRVVNALGLREVNKLPFAGMGGLSWRAAYLFQVGFYDGEATPVGEGIARVHVCKRVVNGGELTHEPHFDVLLGMDILTTGTLRIDRDGTFSFGF
jgi:hypothetical protein